MARFASELTALVVFASTMMPVWTARHSRMDAQVVDALQAEDAKKAAEASNIQKLRDWSLPPTPPLSWHLAEHQRPEAPKKTKPNSENAAETSASSKSSNWGRVNWMPSGLGPIPHFPHMPPRHPEEKPQTAKDAKTNSVKAGESSDAAKPSKWGLGNIRAPHLRPGSWFRRPKPSKDDSQPEPSKEATVVTEHSEKRAEASDPQNQKKLEPAELIPPVPLPVPAFPGFGPLLPGLPPIPPPPPIWSPDDEDRPQMEWGSPWGKDKKKESLAFQFPLLGFMRPRPFSKPSPSPTSGLYSHLDKSEDAVSISDLSGGISDTPVDDSKLVKSSSQSLQTQAEADASSEASSETSTDGDDGNSYKKAFKDLVKAEAQNGDAKVVDIKDAFAPSEESSELDEHPHVPADGNFLKQAFQDLEAADEAEAAAMMNNWKSAQEELEKEDDDGRLEELEKEDDDGRFFSDDGVITLEKGKAVMTADSEDAGEDEKQVFGAFN